MIYETKGLSLEQVDELYAKVPKAWQSKGFVPSVSFQDVRELGGDSARRSSLADVSFALFFPLLMAYGEMTEANHFTSSYRSRTWPCVRSPWVTRR